MTKIRKILLDVQDGKMSIDDAEKEIESGFIGQPFVPWIGKSVALDLIPVRPMSFPTFPQMSDFVEHYGVPADRFGKVDHPK